MKLKVLILSIFSVAVEILFSCWTRIQTSILTLMKSKDLLAMSILRLYIHSLIHVPSTVAPRVNRRHGSRYMVWRSLKCNLSIFYKTWLLQQKTNAWTKYTYTKLVVVRFFKMKSKSRSIPMSISYRTFEANLRVLNIYVRAEWFLVSVVVIIG